MIYDINEVIERKSHIEELDPRQLLENVSRFASIIEVDTKSANFKNLKKDIKETGQLEPVVVYRGKLYDGRHRCEACIDLKRKVKARVFDDDVPEKIIVSLIAKIEDQHKKLTGAQKAINAYEKFVDGFGYSKAKVAEMCNISRETLACYEYIKNDKYAIEHNFVRRLRKGEAVMLPYEQKPSTSIKKIKRDLVEYEKWHNDNDEEKAKDLDMKPDYSNAFIMFDPNERCEDSFWRLRERLGISGIDKSVALIFELLKIAYCSDDCDEDEYCKKITEDRIRAAVVIGMNHSNEEQNKDK